MRKINEFGDFQTNLAFANKICDLLLTLGATPKIIIEPTCGQGSFVFAAINHFKNAKKIFGVEIQENYVKEVKDKIAKLEGPLPKINIDAGDVFTYPFSKLLAGDLNKEILLLGNPPWVTNADLGGKNLPKKSNFKKTNGFDAISGKSNFDISEYVLLHLLKIFNKHAGHMAFLCKTQVARNILQFMPASGIDASDFRIYLFDAKKEFNASVEACLFVCRFGGPPDLECKVFDFSNPEHELKKFGWYNEKFVSNIEKYKNNSWLDTCSKYVWRSGIKHDCSEIMELGCTSGKLKNKLGQEVLIESDLIYPLLKSSDIKEPIINSSKRMVIITQTKPNEDTSHIRHKFPLLWNYLAKHKASFDRRKSIIYKKAPSFSIFGIGNYSFKKYKVAVSGLYKIPTFSLLDPTGKKPIMVDDSCYFLSFDNLNEALISFVALNSNAVKNFLESIVFIDAKRPYTKNILMRIDLLKAIKALNYGDVKKTLKNHPEYLNKFTALKFEETRRKITN